MLTILMNDFLKKANPDTLHVCDSLPLSYSVKQTSPVKLLIVRFVFLCSRAGQGFLPSQTTLQGVSFRPDSDSGR